MSVVIAIPSDIWIRLPGTDWEVFQDSGRVIFLGGEAAIVRIRRADSRPRVWGPRPPVVSSACRGLHCKCMNLDGQCSDPNHGDHDCSYEQAAPGGGITR